MKKLLLFLMIPLFLICNCKKGDSVTEPGNGNIVVADVPEKTVDSKGATLTLGTFTAEIPPNTFTTAAVLTLTRATDKPFGANQKSDIFYLNNLPDVISQPVVLSLSGFSKEDNLITYLAEKTFVPSMNKEIINYRFAPNSFVNGKLQVSVGANSTNKSQAMPSEGTNPVTIGVLAVASQATYSSQQEHFRLTFPSSLISDAMDLAQYLEEAYSKFSSAPLSLSYAGRTTWPVEVSLCPLESTVYGYMATSVWGNNSAYMCFNSNKLADKSELRLTAAHEFMHFVQNLYDPRNRFSKAKLASPQLWLDEATAVWSESMFTSSTNYISAVRKGNEMASYSTIMKVADSGASFYGYGMSSVIKYLFTEVGSDMIKKMYEKILAGEKPAEAIRLATGKIYWEWWGRFIDKHTLGKLYNDIPISALVGNKTDGFTINTANDSVKEFASEYGQLQSKIYITTLNADAFTENASLNFLVKNPNTEMLNVYKFNNNTIENIGQHLSTISIPNIKAVAQAGYKIMTVVTNQKYDYTTTATQNITLITRVKDRPVIKRCFISVAVNCNYKRTYTSGGPGTGTSAYYLSISSIPCIQKGDTVTSVWDGVIDGTPQKGSATFIFQKDKTVTFNIANLATYPTVNASTSTLIKGAGLPYFSASSLAIEYKIAESFPVLQTAWFKEVFPTFTQETTGFYLDPKYPNKSIQLIFYYD